MSSEVILIVGTADTKADELLYLKSCVERAGAVGKVMDVGATFDHRLLDGSHAAKMHRIVRAWMEHPFEHFDALG